MIQAQKEGEAHPHLTVFLYKSQQSEITNAFLIELQKENAGLFHDRDGFIGLIATHFDEFTAAGNGAAAAALSSAGQ